MHARGLAGPVIATLAEAPDQHFAADAQWHAHLSRLGIASRRDPGLAAVQDPVRLASEGALWGSVKAHGFLPETVIVSDDAGQFHVGRHACAGSMPNAWCTSWMRSPTCISVRRATSAG